MVFVWLHRCILSCASDQPVILSQCFSACCLTRLTDEFILLLTGLTGERFCASTVFARRLNRRGAICSRRFKRCSSTGLESLWTTTLALVIDFVGSSGALSPVEPTQFQPRRRFNRCVLSLCCRLCSSVEPTLPRTHTSDQPVRDTMPFSALFSRVGFHSRSCLFLGIFVLV